VSLLALSVLSVPSSAPLWPCRLLERVMSHHDR
jgi:hypothetical protein